MDDEFNFDFSNDAITGDLSEHGSSSRKRSRSSTPTPSGRSATKVADISKPTGQDAILAEKLRDPVQRNTGLNELLRASMTHYQLEGEDILNELTDIVVECLEWEHGRFDNDTKPQPTFKVSQAWLAPLTEELQDWREHWKNLREPEKINCVEAILIILRNLSFAAGNVRLLAFSPHILAILVGSLYEEFYATSPSALTDESSSAAVATNSLALPALQTLINLAPYLDVTGQKLLCDKLFFSQKSEEGPVFPNPTTFGQAADGRWGFGSLWLAKRLDTKEDVVTDMPKKFVLDFTGSFLVQVWSLFPALCFVMSDPKSPRTVLMAALDLMKELMNQARVGLIRSVEQEEKDDMPSARAILVNMPNSVLDRLTDLLYVPRLGPDSLAYEDPTTSIVTRVNFLKLMMTYDQTVDTDVRDRSLDVLVPLLELDSPRMAARLGLNTRGIIRARLYDALVPALAGGVGRTDSAMLATQLLKELSKAKENKVGFTYIQARLIEMASRDPRAAQLALTHLYVISKDEEGKGSADEEDAI